MQIGRMALGVLTAILVDAMLIQLLPSFTFSEYGPAIIGGLVAGYLARQKGWLAGLLLGCAEALFLFMVFAKMGRIFSAKPIFPLSWALILKCLGPVPLAVLAGSVGERLYLRTHRA